MLVVVGRWLVLHTRRCFSGMHARTCGMVWHGMVYASLRYSVLPCPSILRTPGLRERLVQHFSRISNSVQVLFWYSHTCIAAVCTCILHLPRATPPAPDPLSLVMSLYANKTPQDLHEYLKHLVEAISISPSNESMLRNPQVVLDAALTAAEEDPTPAVEKVPFRVLHIYMHIYIYEVCSMLTSPLMHRFPSCLVSSLRGSDRRGVLCVWARLNKRWRGNECFECCAPLLRRKTRGGRGTVKGMFGRNAIADSVVVPGRCCGRLVYSTRPSPPRF